MFKILMFYLLQNYKRFKYLQTMRKLYSTHVSVLLLLLDTGTILHVVREVTRIKRYINV